MHGACFPCHNRCSFLSTSLLTVVPVLHLYAVQAGCGTGWMELLFVSALEETAERQYSICQTSNRLLKDVYKFTLKDSLSVCRSDDASNLGKTGIFWFQVSLLPVPNHRHHIPPHDQPTTPSTKYYTGRAAAGEIVIKRTQKKNESVLHERSESPCFRYFAVVIVRKRLLFGIPLTSSKKPPIAWPLFHRRQKERERHQTRRSSRKTFPMEYSL